MIWSVFLVLAELVNFQPTGKSIFSQKFGQLDDDTPLINKFVELIPTLQDYDSGNLTIGKIQFIYSGYDDILFVACADKAENPLPVLQSLESLKVNFVQKFFPLIQEGKDDAASFRPLKDDLERSFASFIQIEKPVPSQTEAVPSGASPKQISAEPPTKPMFKIAFIGDAEVGKRTLLNLLFTGSSDAKGKPEESEMVMKKGPISEKYNALLITIPNQMIETGKTQFLSNTDVALFVTSSVFKNVMGTRKILDTVKAILPKAHYGVIANKQDVSGAVDIEAIRKIYELPIISMVATLSSNYEKLRTFVDGLIEKA
ncbi:MAG: GTPase domain-containing protein [Candidatus Helarchaeota archaeon]|nr:GTPase domain-containing protein [Candidatus Helarchaeota archaeon]